MEGCYLFFFSSPACDTYTRSLIYTPKAKIPVEVLFKLQKETFGPLHQVGDPPPEPGCFPAKKPKAPSVSETLTEVPLALGLRG